MALYRKYRPASFAEVVGQEHVTDPLRTALAAGRINHAYLFSGPRGCGKTSSARILARSLNCVQGPTPDPCGVCGSCVALAPEGPGSLDVVELDAASHGGVDDTRELRDRAFYMPAESRYRVFIIDEAHMVTPQGFNALLKIVEEPPEHLVFIFATTEPDKVLTTIRSRTHHYPFRLIPPAVLRALLERLCAEEGVVVEPAVFPLVIQAGGGSARDSLSVLDQLLAGAGPEGVTYRSAVALLGVTDTALLDEMVDALAAADGASVFGAVDRVVEAGHDPRRFAADLLQRLRDLLVLHAVPDAGAKGLIDCPEDELAAMAGQAERLGAGTLARIADILHTGLVDMRGTTAPRLVLELLCARMLLPDTSAADGAMLHRLERMERRMAIADSVEPGNGSAPSGRGTELPSGPRAAAPADGPARMPSAPPLPAPPALRTAGADASHPADGGDTAPDRAGADRDTPPASAAGEQAPATATDRPRADPGSTGRSTPTQPTRPEPTRSAPASPTRVPDGPGVVPSLGLPVPPVLSSRRPTRSDTDQASSRQDATARPAPATDRDPTGGPERVDRAAGPRGTGSAGQAGQSANGARADRSPNPDPGERPDNGRPPADRGAGRTEASTASAAPAQGAGGSGPGAIDAADIRKMWPEILAAVKKRRRTTQILLDSATVRSVDRGVLMLTMPSPGMARRVLETANVTILREALVEVAGVDWTVNCDAGGDGGGASPGGGGPRGSDPRRGPQSPDGDVPPPSDADAPVDDAEDIPDDYDQPHDAAASIPVREPVAAAIELLTTQLGARRLEPPPV
nr:DNA polymerase III subunit gamma and tau [Nakamurella flavida]